MTSRRMVALLVVVGVVASGWVVAGALRERAVGGEFNGAEGLRSLAPIDIGSAVDPVALREYTGYRAELAREFSSLTPENAMKWDSIEAVRGKRRWDDADAAVAFAREHDMAVRGHTLIWHNQLPTWLAYGDWRRADLARVLKGHIEDVVGRYRGRVAEWDVLNEIVAEDGRSLRRSLWSRVLGDGFPAQALRWARAADPDARLYINEIAADGIGRKSDGLYRLVRRLRRDGVPLDGVGLQAHFNLDGVPTGFEDNLRRFAALGLDVRITELDVAVKVPASDRALAAQARIYAEVARSCLRVARCRGITVWGFTDRFSWIPASQAGLGAATLLDAALDPKPAYRAFARELGRGRPDSQR